MCFLKRQFLPRSWLVLVGEDSGNLFWFVKRDPEFSIVDKNAFPSSAVWFPSLSSHVLLTKNVNNFFKVHNDNGCFIKKSVLFDDNENVLNCERLSLIR